MQDSTKQNDVRLKWKGPSEEQWLARIAAPSMKLKKETLPWIKNLNDVLEAPAAAPHQTEEQTP